jgi:LPS export ABC transporter protein LptC
MRLFWNFNFLKLLFPLLTITFVSCENDIKVINIIGNKDNLLVDSSKNVEMIYSDSAKVVLIVKAPLVNRYEGDNPHSEMPKGVELYSYDSLMNVKSKLTANYAISYEKTDMMEARNNVIVVNERKEQLNTEHLVWDQKKATIYSDKFVKINTGKEILWGEGMQSDERFDKWKIMKPKGSINVRED